MREIIVKDYINSAFSQGKAIILREIIEKELVNTEKIILNFAGVTKFTTLFFNFSTGYYISLLGPDLYNKRISLVNLSDLGESIYNSSYQNAVEKYDPDKNVTKIEKELLEILSNPED